VGYLEEQAVVTYSHIIDEIDKGNLPMWKVLPAPPIAVDYWQLPRDSMVQKRTKKNLIQRTILHLFQMRDVILAIRADEAHHRLVNHTLASMDMKAPNPFKPGH